MTDAPVTRSTFNFIEAVLDRNYPEFEVPVYLDEGAAQKLIEAASVIKEIETLVGNSNNPGIEWAERLEKAEADRDELVEQLRAKKYTIKVRGIAPEEHVKLEEKNYEEFPLEYTESQSPITGAIIKTPVDDDKRDEEFALLIRQAHIVSVTAPDGAVDDDWSDREKVRTMLARLPLLARAHLDAAIQDCTIQVDYYRELVDEVF